MKTLTVSHAYIKGITNADVLRRMIFDALSAARVSYHYDATTVDGGTLSMTMLLYTDGAGTNRVRRQLDQLDAKLDVSISNRST